MADYKQVDPRFSEIIEDILGIQWLIPSYITQSQLAELLEVRRQSLFQWLTKKTNISKKVGLKFLDESGLRGYFSQRVLEIYESNRDILPGELVKYVRK